MRSLINRLLALAAVSTSFAVAPTVWGGQPPSTAPAADIPTAVTSAAVTSAAANLAAANLAAAPLGKKIEGFSLRDYHGKVYSLADDAAKNAVVITFVGVDCPLATLYAPRLAQLAKEFAPQGVAFLAIDANRQDSVTELAAYARQHGITFPVLKDAGNVVADLLGATRTPEVFVLDRERIVRYRGRIDDQYGVGFRRPKPQRRDLAAALDEVVSGKPVSEPVTEATGCLIGRVPKKESRGGVTYSNQIARLLNERCVRCHRAGEIAPFPLTEYEEVAGWADTIREVVQDGRMPPWFASSAHGKFANDARLNDAEKQLVAAWVADGCPEGDRAQLPPKPQFTEGWAIPQPDRVIYMDEQPANVAAEGVLPYRYLITDPHFKEDKWIQAIEARPGNRAVVHHIIVSFIRPGERPNLGLGGGPLVGYAPGMPPVVYPPGTAQFVPKGSKVVFQVHYTPNGSPQKDLSCVGTGVRRPQERQKSGLGRRLAQYRFPHPGWRRRLRRAVEPHFSRGRSASHAHSAHAHARQGLPLRGPVSRRKPRDSPGRAAIRLQLAASLRIGRAQVAPPRHSFVMYGALRQLGEQPEQSQPAPRDRLGRPDVGRNDDRLLHDHSRDNWRRFQELSSFADAIWGGTP